MNRRLASIVAGVAFLLLILPPARALDEIAIHQIQFTADPSGVSPFNGRTITTGGIVTSLYPTGYSIQEPLSGPWSGIFVEDSARRPILGNFVVLSARVVEENGQTLLREISSFTIINSGNAIPQPVDIQTPDIVPGSPTAESFEGVLVGTGKASITAVSSASDWEIADSTGIGARIGNLAGYGYAPQVGNDLAKVQGVVFFANGVNYIEPRNDDDLFPITPRPNVIGIVSLQWRSNPSGVVVQLSGLPTAVTKSDGTYSLAAVPPGMYTIRAYAPGFLPAERSSVEIKPGHTISLPSVTLIGGDANGDGRIDLMDLTLVARNYGLCPPPDSWSDLTGDNCVNLMDLVLVSQNYNLVGPTSW